MATLGWVLFFVALLSGYLFLWPVVEPQQWTPKTNPGFTAPYHQNDLFKKAIRVFEGEVSGPETITAGPSETWLYTGLRDGRVVRFDIDRKLIELVSDQLVSPGGMQFNAEGQLIIADTSLGLVSLKRDGSVMVLVDQFEGRRLLFPDDLDIAADGRIWFSDATMLFPEHEDAKEFISGQSTGRLFSFDPVTESLCLELDNLHFANGVALGPGEEYVLVAESLGFRIKKLWLKGDRAGDSEIWLENLPAFPDNIWYDTESGLFWVAFFMTRKKIHDDLHALPIWLKKMLLRLPLGLIGGSARDLELSWVVAFDTSGKLVHNYENHDGYYGGTSSAIRVGDRLFVGSISAQAVAYFELPHLP